MSIIGKWQEVAQTKLAEFFQAIGLPDPAPDTEASFEWTQNEDGAYTEVFDTGVSVTSKTFVSGVEENGSTITVSGATITQVDKLPNGNVLNCTRVFEGDSMTATLTSNATDVVATIDFKKV